MRLAVTIAALLFHAEASAADAVKLKSSLYYSALQEDYAAGSNSEFRDARGRAIAKGSAEFVAAASIEGTAELADGRVLNFDRLVNGEVRWKAVAARYGLDARGCALVPFRSVAVDPSIVPLGSRLFIADTVGLPLPTGDIHDGFWIATDTGRSIKGKRVDLFVGRGMAAMKAVEDFGITYLSPLRAKIVDQDSSCP